jgi:RNA polymerase sigma factor (sigma-70 family)
MRHRRLIGQASVADGDAELITAVRGGDTTAYGVLYLRHVDAARRLARTLVRDQADVDDLVAEAFAKILSTLRGGGGRDLAFRPYLLASLRNTFYDRLRRDKRVDLTGDIASHDPGVPFVDTAVEGLERSLAARAFARLPERCQVVLWHLEVERETPAEVGLLLGLSPNGVSALAYRSRERLRQAYLQEHIAERSGVDCDWTAERLGAHVRGGLSRRDKTRVEGHLGSCPRCRLLHVELAEVNSCLRGVLAPVVLGVAAAGYLLHPAHAAAALAAGAAGAASGSAGTGAAAGGGAVAGGTGAAGTGAAGTGAAGTGAAVGGASATGAATTGTAATGAAAAGAAATGTAATGAAAGAAAPAFVGLGAGQGALAWASGLLVQAAPLGVAAGSKVGAAAVAVAVGTALVAGAEASTAPPPAVVDTPHPSVTPLPQAPMPFDPAPAETASPTPEPSSPEPASPSAASPTPSGTPTPSDTATPTPSPSDAPAQGDPTPTPAETPAPPLTPTDTDIILPFPPWPTAEPSPT